MKHGAENLALITTDAYRIGGFDQLSIYGKILDVVVFAVKDEAELKSALNDCKSKHTVLIDTAGLSQKDKKVTNQLNMLLNANADIKNILCLNSGSTMETLTDVVHSYQSNGIEGCVITKTDESASLGGVLSVIIQNKMKVFYETNGQRVPEDIRIFDKHLTINGILTSEKSRPDIACLFDDGLTLLLGANSVKKNKKQVDYA
jgi:flagellar biosynthesis protein FlhF